MFSPSFFHRFSIGAAYQRREEALRSLSSLRAGIAALYFAHRDWVSDSERHALRSQSLGKELYEAVRRALMAKADERNEDSLKVYAALSAYSRMG